MLAFNPAMFVRSYSHQTHVKEKKVLLVSDLHIEKKKGKIIAGVLWSRIKKGQINYFGLAHFYTISTSEEKPHPSIWTLPDALRMKSIMLQSNYAPLQSPVSLTEN